jgi:hypothetical protein
MDIAQGGMSYKRLHQLPTNKRCTHESEKLQTLSSHCVMRCAEHFDGVVLDETSVKITARKAIGSKYSRTPF